MRTTSLSISPTSSPESSPAPSPRQRPQQNDWFFGAPRTALTPFLMPEIYQDRIPRPPMTGVPNTSDPNNNHMQAVPDESGTIANMPRLSTAPLAFPVGGAVAVAVDVAVAMALEPGAALPIAEVVDVGRFNAAGSVEAVALAEVLLIEMPPCPLIPRRP